MPSVQRADADREGEVEQFLALTEFELFDSATRNDRFGAPAQTVTAWAIARGERSMPSTYPEPMRAATSRAAAPGPQPISRTRSPGFSGSASTIAFRRADSIRFHLHE